VSLQGPTSGRPPPRASARPLGPVANVRKLLPSPPAPSNGGPPALRRAPNRKSRIANLTIPASPTRSFCRACPETIERFLVGQMDRAGQIRHRRSLDPHREENGSWVLRDSWTKTVIEHSTEHRLEMPPGARTAYVRKMNAKTGCKTILGSSFLQNHLCSSTLFWSDPETKTPKRQRWKAKVFKTGLQPQRAETQRRPVLLKESGHSNRLRFMTS
jgi:hypothetical protein